MRAERIFGHRRESSIAALMTVIGFRIHIDGVLRSFHDIREVAFGMARTLKARHRQSKVEIVDERTGNAVEMLEDGRIA